MRHSVALNIKKCRGCTTCIKNCPTEAIRVRSGKATILPNRCIDCGTCVQVCPHKAVQSQHTYFYMLQRFRYNIAVPDPALYAQFQRLDDITITLTDRGPGIPDIEQAMQAGWTTAADSVRTLGFGAGMGLPNMKKYSDEMTVESVLGVGTTVTMVVRIE